MPQKIPSFRGYNIKGLVSCRVLHGPIQGRKSQTANQQTYKAFIGWITSLNNINAVPCPAIVERTAGCILQRSGENRVAGHLPSKNLDFYRMISSIGTRLFKFLARESRERVFHTFQLANF
ncbi:hypothetical protein N7522_009871 [Penicillium canescens]|nr:hypothetical protein N7522_009871 [Penicillium canescens]